MYIIYNVIYNVILMVALKVKSGGRQSHEGSSSGDHEYTNIVEPSDQQCNPKLYTASMAANDLKRAKYNSCALISDILTTAGYVCVCMCVCVCVCVCV